MQFIFTHNASLIRPLLSEVLQYLEELLIVERTDTEDLLHRCKFIITELCTNAIKHSGEAKSILHIYTQEGTLIIKKTDTGKPFSSCMNNIDISFPLAPEIDTLVLMEDDINRLNLQRVDDYNATFYAEQLNLPVAAGKRLNEHFGLVLICLSADSFTYTHDPYDGSNIFIASINLV
ncbi:MAG TPA: hypothetical protein VG738_12675 [Chitinophagaceae bacterium]|nr:hypothetical protein [Chitinophagaceae bacterium]